MRTLYTALYLFILSATILLSGGCTNEDESDTNTITLKELPSNAHTYLTFLFPDKLPLKVEKASGSDTIVYQFKATYADEVSFNFDKAGDLMKIDMPNGATPEEVAKRYIELYEYVTTAFPQSPLIGITRTGYGMFATLSDGQTAAFSIGGEYFGKELGAEGYTALPEGIRQLVALHFPEVGYKYIIESTATDETAAYKYQIWLNNQCTIRVNPQGQWADINGNGQALPQTLIRILPEKIQKKMQNMKSIYQISIRNDGKEYQIWDSPSSSTIFDTEDRPPVNLMPKELLAFIDEYFGPVTSKSITVPAGHDVPLQYTVQLPNGFNFILGPQQLYDWSEVDGHGYPFLPMQEKLLPESALQYIADNSEAKVTKAQRLPDGYLLILTDGTAYQFTFAGQFISQQEVTPTAYQKAYTYMRYQYPKNFTQLGSFIAKEGWTFILDDGTQIKFDLEGNLIQ